MVILTDQNFENQLRKSSCPVLVDFWAPWCGPCRRLGPALEELEREMKGKIIIGKVNVDEAPTTARRYGAQRIPSLLLFRDGGHGGMLVGPDSLQAVRNWLQGQL